MIKAILLFMTLSILSGCEREDAGMRLAREVAHKSFTTRAYNYTPYDLYSIAYKDVSLPFDIANAPDGGSVFSRNASRREMDNGKEVSYGSDTCCLIWDKPTDKPLKVRVVWSVVHDLDAFDGKASKDIDERNFKRAGPGNRWCEAIVDIVPLGGTMPPDTVIFHFLPDGTVQAHLGTNQSGTPLPSALVARHASPLPQGEFCKREIDNPYFGIPRTPHRE